MALSKTVVNNVTKYSSITTVSIRIYLCISINYYDEHIID